MKYSNSAISAMWQPSTTNYVWEIPRSVALLRSYKATHIPHRAPSIPRDTEWRRESGHEIVKQSPISRGIYECLPRSLALSSGIYSLSLNCQDTIKSISRNPPTNRSRNSVAVLCLKIKSESRNNSPSEDHSLDLGHPGPCINMINSE